MKGFPDAMPDSDGPAAEACEAFGDLYAAGGLPRPAVLMFGTEGAYREAARAASAHDAHEAARKRWNHLAREVSFYGGMIAFTLLFFAMPRDGQPDGTSMAFGAVMFVFLLLFAAAEAWARHRRRHARRFAALAAASGNTDILSTPAALRAMLSSALLFPNGPARRTPPGEERFLDACLRLGAVRVLPPAPSPFLNHLGGAHLRGGPGTPRILALAASASATADEAVLMSGLVLALAPGAASSRAPVPVEAPPDPSDPAAPPRGKSVPPSVASGMASLVRSALAMRPATAEGVLREIGLERAVGVLGIAPASDDGSGKLYRLSPALCALRVEDKVAGPDGKPLVHWMFVPTHMVTAREAVAWSFGLPEGAYAPSAES